MSENKEVLLKQDITPVQMIMAAITGHADLDKIEKLLTLQERWEANEARKAYHKAMAEFKANPPKINKDKQVGYSTNAGKVGYSHASLGNVTEKISSELSKYGLSASWTTDQTDKISVTCHITHSLGHSERTTLSANADKTGSKNEIQAVGSTITYLERYTLLALTGLATYEDDDCKDSGERISEQQLSNILDLLNAKELKEAPILKYMGVEKMEDILASDFNKVVKAIEQAPSKAK